MLIPDQSTSALGGELLGGALLNLLVAIPRQRRRLTLAAPGRSDYALLVAVFDGAQMLIIAGGATFVAGYDFALYLLAPAVIALALLAIANAWKLTLVGSEPVGEI